MVWKISDNSTASKFVYRLVHCMNSMNILSMVKTRSCERIQSIGKVSYFVKLTSNIVVQFCRAKNIER
jgi:hypothetical protein